MENSLQSGDRLITQLAKMFTKIIVGPKLVELTPDVVTIILYHVYG